MPKIKSSPKIKAVLFDLGKVILDFDFTPAFRRLARVTAFTPAEIDAYFRRSGLEVLYDGGKISSLAFYREIKKALRHPLTYAEFKKLWNEIFTPKAKVIRLIRRLKPRYRLVLISNTNAMHFDHIRSRYPVLGLFDAWVLSYRENTRKPDPRIYRTAIRACKACAGEIFYIDDREDLTVAAAGLGLRTFTFKNDPDALIREMTRLGILK